MEWGKLVHAISEAMTANADHLNALDAQLGDGDHGTSVAAAFRAAAERATSLGNAADGEILKAAALALMNSSGGSSGALYGSLFLRASTVAPSVASVTTAGIAAMMQAGLDAVVQRGGAHPGDKTMVDALQPAVEVLKAAAKAQELPAYALKMAAQAAHDGAQATAHMTAKHGRAKFIGERSLGHVDAGAQSIAVMFDAIARYWKENIHD